MGLPVLKVLVVNTIILKLSSSLMFLISPVLDVIPLILALLNLNFHLLMLSMLLLEEFPSTLHQIQLQLEPQLQLKPELQLHQELELHLELEPQPHPELHLHLDHVSHSVLAQVSLAKLHTILMMMISPLDSPPSSPPDSPLSFPPDSPASSPPLLHSLPFQPTLTSQPAVMQEP